MIFPCGILGNTSEKVNARKPLSLNALETACLSIFCRCAYRSRPLVCGCHRGLRFGAAEQLALALQSGHSSWRNKLCRHVRLSTHGEATQVTSADGDSPRLDLNCSLVSACREPLFLRGSTLQPVMKCTVPDGLCRTCLLFPRPQPNLFLHRLQRIDHEPDMFIEIDSQLRGSLNNIIPID